MTDPVLPVEPVGRAVGATATLSTVGGFVDVVGFIALFGLFTAHVTGNFLLGVAATAVQNAGSRLILQNHGPTTMMTGNTTQAVIDLVDPLRGLPGEHPEARKRLKLLVPAILVFTVGALLGAYAHVTFSFWCLVIPIVALLALGWRVATRMAASA